VIKTLNFAHATVRRMAIKREPGENPGQTRCCNPPLYRGANNEATDIFSGRRSRPGGKSEDLPCCFNNLPQPRGLGFRRAFLIFSQKRLIKKAKNSRFELLF